MSSSHTLHQAEVKKISSKIFLKSDNAKNSTHFLLRVCDYAKPHKDKSLSKNIKRFTPTKGPVFAGSSALGPHLKTQCKNGAEKIYYLAEHKPQEYFALEILQRLGVHTPKSRLITSIKEEGKIHITATKSIPNYLPMIAVREDAETNDPKILALRKKYQIKLKEQIVVDLESKTEHKISGQLFCMDIAGLLIDDRDVQPDAFNLGVIRVGKRFFAVAIDKDYVAFDGKTYSDLLEDPHRFAQNLYDALFQAKTQEQALALVAEVINALAKNKDGICDFDEIFLNPRVELTKELRNKYKICQQNFKVTANSLISYYQEKYGTYFLEEFAVREKIREKIANVVINNLYFKNNQIDKDDLFQLIVSDLRAPYYQSLFTNKSEISKDDANNKNLINKILKDVCDEFGLTLKKQEKEQFIQDAITSPDIIFFNSEKIGPTSYFGMMKEMIKSFGFFQNNNPPVVSSPAKISVSIKY